MTPTKLLFGQIIVVFAIVLAGVWFATQWAAAELAYQPELGRPWFNAFGRPIYLPWALFGWWFSFEAYAPVLFETAGGILLPNDRAIEPQSREAYQRFGLNDRQIELVSRATPKRQYYLQSARGNRLFELDLGPIALALCGTSDPATQVRIDAMIAESGTRDFAARFLASAGLEWTHDLLASNHRRAND